MAKVRHAVIEDLPALLEIYNQVVTASAATFDLEKQTIEERQKWFDKFTGRYPLIVAETTEGVTGYCCLSSFRAKPAYADTCELSIYISDKARQKGIGSLLMEKLISIAKKQNFHTIIGGAAGDNSASKNLLQKYDFKYVGTFKEVGFKFGDWQDVSFFQLIL